METIAALWKAMRIGAEIDDPALWKNRQQFGNKLGMLILAVFGIAKAFGYDFTQYVDENSALVIGGAIATVWNIVLTYATSKKVGIGVQTEPTPLVQDGQSKQSAAKSAQNTGNDDLYRG